MKLKQVTSQEQHLVELFNAGDVEKCILACKEALDADATNAMANNLLGSSLAKNKSFQEAIFNLECAVKLQPKNPTFLFNLALAQFNAKDIDSSIRNYKKTLNIKNNLPIVHYNLAKAYGDIGDVDRAIRSCRKAINFDKGFIKAYLLMCNLYKSLNKFKDAEKLYVKLVDLDENSVESLAGLARCYSANNEYVKACKCYERLIEINGKDARTWHDLGVNYWKLTKFDEAISCYKKAIQINPQYAIAYTHLGVAYNAKKDIKNAVLSFKRSLFINADNSSTNYNYANVLRESKKWGSSIKYYREAISLDDKNGDAFVNMAVALTAINREGDAYAAINDAIKIDPKNKHAYLGLGNYFINKGEIDKALEFCHKATEIDSSYVAALWNESIIHLLKGDFAIGWELYKCRMEKEEFDTVKARMSGKTWSGEPIAGKTVLLHHEQGIGDTFQFIRYVKQLADLGATVYVDCPSGIAAIITSVEGVSATYSKVTDFPNFDYNCPLLNLPAVFKTTLQSIPNEVPYISVGAELPPQIEFDKNKINIGVVWAGNPNHAKDAIRSCDYKLIEGLFGVNEKAMFYSLQVGERAQDLQFTAELGRNIEDLSELLTNFSVTASVINSLDLVITVDTSVAHLAGALGKPVWTLLQFSPDWRWMMDRNDTPWYPTMQLFRQPKAGDWDSVFKGAAKALSGFQPL